MPRLKHLRILAVGLLFAASSYAGTITSTLEEPLLGPVNISRSTIVRTQGITLRGGYLMRYPVDTGDTKYVSDNLCLECSAIRIEIPQGSREITFVVYGYGVDWRGRRTPLQVSDGSFRAGIQPGSGEQLVAIPESSGTIVVDAPSATYGWGMSIDNISYTPPETNLFTVQVEVLTNAAAPFTIEKKLSSTNKATAEIALGTIFKIRIVKKGGFLEPVIPVLGTYTRGTDTINPAFTQTGTHLFPRQVLAGLSLQRSSEMEQTFIAVHLGETSLEIRPQFPAGPTSNVAIRVVRPGPLGTNENTWDTIIVDAAHERGIPPQHLKGHAAQESPNGKTFVTNNYRYEPCGSDYNQVSKGATLINKSPFNQFALDDDIGSGLDSDIFKLRNRYSIPTAFNAKGEPTVRRKLSDADRDVKARDIFMASDKWPFGGSSGQNWSDYCGAWIKYTATNKTASLLSFMTNKLDFVAQTAVASSYGLYQVMYTTAIDENWSVTDPATNQKSQDMKFLIDTPQNHLIKGGGSIGLGSNYVAKRLSLTNGNPWASVALYEAALKEMFKLYNSQKPGYGDGVLKHSRDYVPRSPVTFQ